MYELPQDMGLCLSYSAHDQVIPPKAIQTAYQGRFDEGDGMGIKGLSRDCRHQQ
jgi:hypothetical protein